jgi:hypothetical protein
VCCNTKTPEGQIHEVMRTDDPLILQNPSQSSIYRGHMALDPLVQILGTPGNFKFHVLKISEGRSNESR